MRIAVWHNLPGGGAKRALYDQIVGLLGRGHHIEAWCPATVDQSSLSLGSIVREHRVKLAWQPTGTSQFERAVALLWGNRKVSRMFQALDQHCQECADQITAGGFDLVFSAICVYSKVPPLPRYLKIPCVLYLPEPSRDLFEAPLQPWAALPPLAEIRGLPKKYLKQLATDFFSLQGCRVRVREEIANARTFDTILVNSYFSRENVLRAYGINSIVCYLGIDTDRFNLRKLPREDFVVGVGVIDAAKNIHFILEAIACLPEPRPALIWIGNRTDHDYAQKLHQLAAGLGVQFFPKINVTDDALIETLNQASVGVYAPRLEPFGYAPLEANACGLPVVAVAEGGLRETIVDGVNGLVVDATPEAFACGIQRLRTDQNRARSLGQSARDHVVQHWSLDASIDRLEKQLFITLARHRQ